VSDVLLVVLAVVIVGLPSINWYVFGQLRAAAWPKPREPFLTSNTIVSLGIAVSSTFGGILGVHTLVFTWTEIRLLPQGFAVYLIAAALIVVSLPNIYMLRTLRRLEATARDAHLHARGLEPPRYHRRRDDTPPTTPPGDAAP
jgi:hypothetical protein